MEVAVLLTVWKRPEITRICFDNLKRAGLTVFCAVSEDWAEQMCKEYGFDYIRHENKPLGKKKNALMEFALHHRWDKIMEMGSDNLLNLNMLDSYLSVPADHYGVSCMYFVKGNKAKYYDSFNKIWGAGRVISRQAVEDSIPLWDNGASIYMDSQANRMLDKNGYKHSVCKIPILVDIKTDVNIHPYSRFSGKPVNFDKLSEQFPELKQYTKLHYYAEGNS